MNKPVAGKSYLFVQCKSCSKHFRVVDEPVFEGEPLKVKLPQTLTCPGCKAVGQYEGTDMHISSVQRHKRPGF